MTKISVIIAAGIINKYKKPTSMQAFYLFMILACNALLSCNYVQKPKPEKINPVARVGNHFLYAEDLSFLFKDRNKITDSVSLVKSYIDDWIRRKLLLETALKYLPAEKQNVEKQIQDYRESLLIYIYEDELLKQKLDTNITETAIDSFYQANKQNFLLNEDLVQIMYVKMAKNAPKTDSVKYLLASNSDKKRKQLAHICYRYAADFYLKDSLWIAPKTLSSKIPVEPDVLRLLRTGHIAEVEDSNYLYFLKVNEYKEKGSVAPLNHIREDLRFMLINKRKQQLLASAYEKIYQDAIKENYFELYSK
jgi:hypothetical protein